MMQQRCSYDNFLLKVSLIVAYIKESTCFCTIPYARLLKQKTENSNCCPKSWKQIEQAFICSVNDRWPIMLRIIMKTWAQEPKKDGQFSQNCWNLVQINCFQRQQSSCSKSGQNKWYTTSQCNFLDIKSNFSPQGIGRIFKNVQKQ